MDCQNEDDRGVEVTDLPSLTGRLEQAKRFALMRFEKWNDVTGYFPKHTGYYYEIQGVIEDGVEYGFGVAHGQSWKEIMKRIKKHQNGDW